MTKETRLTELKGRLEYGISRPVAEEVAENLFDQSHRGTYRFECTFQGLDKVSRQQFDIEAANPYDARLMLWRAIANRINAHRWTVIGVECQHFTFTPQKGEGASRLIREEMDTQEAIESGGRK